MKWNIQYFFYKYSISLKSQAYYLCKFEIPQITTSKRAEKYLEDQMKLKNSCDSDSWTTVILSFHFLNTVVSEHLIVLFMESNKE